MTAALADIIGRRIAREGAIPFRDFMDMALYYPGLGYYVRERAKIGREGDFYTSPHLHPAFGATLGLQALECWRAMGEPPEFDIVEFGAGHGYLALDMLGYLARTPLFPRISYTIVETSPALIARQREVVAQFSGVVRWMNPTDLIDVRGLVLSNELLDAFPVHLVEVREGRLMEIYVDLAGEAFVEEMRPAAGELKDYFERFGIDLPDGYRTEANLDIQPWLAEVSRALTEGFVLTIDYGYPAHEYYSPGRHRGTLICYRRHRADEEPYADVGERDITAHVNFTALRAWGEDFGLRCMGYTRQGPYLISLGIGGVLEEMHGGSPNYEDHARKVHGLILPAGMGESHKAMLQYKGPERAIPLAGFALRNEVQGLF